MAMSKVTTATQHCPLCESIATHLWWQDTRRGMNQREYHVCKQCQLIFVPKYFHLTPAQEKEYYGLHENNADDLGYRRFLSRAFEPVVARLPAHAQGLDFGSGPGPTLSLMFAEAGYSCRNYDPYFAPDPNVWESAYDFITSTEVVEHLRSPKAVFEQLALALKPAGLLAIMTQRPRDLESFSKWQYSLDPTHICYYSEATFAWIAQHFALNLEFLGTDVVIFRKP